MCGKNIPTFYNYEMNFYHVMKTLINFGAPSLLNRI